MYLMAWILHELGMNKDYSLAEDEPLNAEEFAELDAMLDGLRRRHDTTPRWEFCEGFMVALICCRRQIAAADYLPVMLGKGDSGAPTEGLFADETQQQRFMDLWARRWNGVMHALDCKITALDDEGAYQPQVIDAPSFAQGWATGFMAAVKAWPEDWAASRNKAAIKWLSTALAFIVALTEDDKASPTMSAFDDGEGVPILSSHRMTAFADALWAVYNLREMGRKLGPRIETVHKAATPGRNDPCLCQSGKKYKKCCG